MTDKRLLEILRSGANFDYEVGKDLADGAIEDGIIQNLMPNGVLVEEYVKTFGADIARGFIDRARERMVITYA